MALQTSQRTINAVVVSAGLMQKTVKVRIGAQQWNSHIRKVFPSH
jgi:small subunit ribosomal protein S17